MRHDFTGVIQPAAADNIRDVRRRPARCGLRQIASGQPLYHCRGRLHSSLQRRTRAERLHRRVVGLLRHVRIRERLVGRGELFSGRLQRRRVLLRLQARYLTLRPRNIPRLAADFRYQLRRLQPVRLLLFIKDNSQPGGWD
ncbi:hypothetical protein ACX3P5_06905 [Pantoea sp. S-LA4]